MNFISFCARNYYKKCARNYYTLIKKFSWTISLTKGRGEIKEIGDIQHKPVDITQFFIILKIKTQLSNQLKYISNEISNINKNYKTYVSILYYLSK